MDFYFIGNNKCMPVDIDPIAKHYLEEGHYLAKFYLSPKGSQGTDQWVHEIEEILRREYIGGKTNAYSYTIITAHMI